jgi:hypothetical protein
MIKEVDIQYITADGMETAKGYLLPGMHKSALAIIALPNNGGTVSYGVTHVPTGIAVIRARTDSFDLVASALRKLWKHLQPEHKQLLKLKGRDEIEAHPAFTGLAIVVRSVTEGLEHKIAEQIQREVRDERNSR